MDDLINVSGRPLTGFAEFLEGLMEANIPCVWLTGRNRHQLDSTLRKLGNSQPFIGEGGACVYLAEDYFHLKPAKTVRLGRFIAIPVAKPLPAAAEALELVSEHSAITVVPLRSLSPRELIQNTGLSKQDAESIRQRDFDELFFFAGATDADIRRFCKGAAHLKFSVRPHGSLWSMAVNPSVATCVRELRKLYDRAFHKAAFAIALATYSEGTELFPACDRAIVLTDRNSPQENSLRAVSAAPRFLPLFGAETWPSVLEAIQTRHF
jgi:predicted mannosyl-3-phosphoglycerate phosphatase (HAD superfamily)